MPTPYEDVKNDWVVNICEKSYCKQDLFPVPDSHISVLILEPEAGQIKFLGRPPHVLVDAYKDGCTKFHGLIRGVIIRVYSSTSFGDVQPKARFTWINYATYCLQCSHYAHKCRSRHQGRCALWSWQSRTLQRSHQPLHQ
jgi:hypothetical protein